MTDFLPYALLFLSLGGGFAAAWIFSYKPHNLLVWLAFFAASFVLLGWLSLAGLIFALALRWRFAKKQLLNGGFVL